VHAILFCSVAFGETSSLAVIHTTHERPWLCIMRNRAWYVSHCIHNHGRPWLLTARGAWSSDTHSHYKWQLWPISAINWPRCSSYQSQSQIVVENRYFSLPHLHSTPPLGGPYQNIPMTFGTEKLEWCGYPTVKKTEETFTRFDRIHERDRRTHTHGQTAWRHRPRLHSIARQ